MPLLCYISDMGVFCTSAKRDEARYLLGHKTFGINANI